MNQPLMWLHQLARTLDEQFVMHVHRRGVDGKNPEEDSKKLRSRALAAMASHIVAGVSHRTAGERVTDYFHDDGIDGFAIATTNSSTATIYLVQAKWSPGGKHTFKPSETASLVEGLAKLREGQLHRDNLLNNHLGEIEPAITTPGTKICLVFATSGNKPVPDDAKQNFGNAVQRYIGNDIDVQVEYLLLKNFVTYLETTITQPGVSVSAPLLRDRSIDEQYPSLQGTISAAELGQWYLDHTEEIFDQNVRLGIDSGVNDEIVNCLIREPENFWYFNNGVTALCNHWRRAPTSGREVPYEFTNLRIVNGAQTVSSIGRAMQENRGSVARAQVPIRFVALDTKGPRFGARIAYATNRANPMLPRDFLAMDHVQQRLRDEFTLTWGHTYAIRTRDKVPKNSSGCSVLEAIIAMACGRHSVNLLVDAKYDISSLWRTQDENYRMLFNDRTSVVEVWRRVRALRQIMDVLQRDDATASQRIKTVAVLGDLFLAYIVFRRLGDREIADIESGWDDQLSSIEKHTLTALNALSANVDNKLSLRAASKNPWRDVTSLLGNRKWLTDCIESLVGRNEMSTTEHQTSSSPWPPDPEFELLVRTRVATGRICDGGFLVKAGSSANIPDQSSLSATQLRHRQNLRDSLGFVEEGRFLQLTRDASFESPSQAAAVLMGHSVNGAGGWTTADGETYSEFVKSKA